MQHLLGFFAIITLWEKYEVHEKTYQCFFGILHKYTRTHVVDQTSYLDYFWSHGAVANTKMDSNIMLARWQKALFNDVRLTYYLSKINVGNGIKYSSGGFR